MKTRWYESVTSDTKKATSTPTVHPAVWPKPMGIGQYKDEYKPRSPDYNPADVSEIIKATPIARGIFYTIEREIFDTGVDIVPLFDKKCGECGATYSMADTVCENTKCKNKGGKLDEPDISHKIAAQAIQNVANRDDDAATIQKGMLQNDLGYANYYVSIAYKHSRRFKGQARKAAEIYLEDPVLIRKVGDDYGHLGDPEQLICISCNDDTVYGRSRSDYMDFTKSYKPSKSERYVEISDEDIINFRKSKRITSPDYKVLLCPKCGGRLEPTAYIKLKNATSNEIDARFTKSDMIDGSSTRIPPAYYGVSGLIIAWKLLQSMNAMDDLNRQTYTGKHLGAIINWKNMDQEEVNEIVRKANEIGLNSIEYDPVTGQYSSTKGLAQVHIASDEAGVQYINVLDDFTKLQSLDYYNKYGDILGMIYGVPPAYMNWAQQGGGSRDPSMQKDIILSGVRERIEWLENEWNKKILPLFGITDYGIKFGSVSTKEDFRKVQIEQIKANVVRLYAESGLKGEFDDRNNFVITGEMERQPPPEMKRLPDTRQPRAKISSSSDQLVEG